jgi:hypothetical protein
VQVKVAAPAGGGHVAALVVGLRMPTLAATNVCHMAFEA